MWYVPVVLQQFLVHNFLITAFYCYDYLLTLDQEWNTMWRKHPGLIGTLVLLNRYTTLLGYAPVSFWITVSIWWEGLTVVKIGQGNASEELIFKFLKVRRCLFARYMLAYVCWS